MKKLVAEVLPSGIHCPIPDELDASDEVEFDQSAPKGTAHPQLVTLEDYGSPIGLPFYGSVS